MSHQIYDLNQSRTALDMDITMVAVVDMSRSSSRLHGALPGLAPKLSSAIGSFVAGCFTKGRSPNRLAVLNPFRCHYYLTSTTYGNLILRKSQN